MWDHEVDVLCVGGLVGAFAIAVVAVDAGFDVLVATAAAGDLGWPTDQVRDEETVAYFAALTDGLPTAPQATVDVPVRPIQPFTAADCRRVPTFYGARLTGWTGKCLVSPYGLMHTKVADWRTTTMRTPDNCPVQVKTVGTVALPATGGPVPLRTWLGDEARVRNVDIESETRLRRLVFEDGVVIGAVLETTRGQYAVRSRQGVTLAPGVGHVVTACVRGDDAAEVALVSEIGSRFARVELLAAAPPVATPAVTCSSSNRRVPVVSCRCSCAQPAAPAAPRRPGRDGEA